MNNEYYKDTLKQELIAISYYQEQALTEAKMNECEALLRIIKGFRNSGKELTTDQIIELLDKHIDYLLREQEIAADHKAAGGKFE